jgi:hypothetical protein
MFSTPHLGIPGSMLAHRPGMTGEIAQARATCTVVMRGLDPASINLRKNFSKGDGLPGQARQ